MSQLHCTVTRKLSDNFNGVPSAKKCDFFIEFKLNDAKIIVHRSVLIERAHYYAIHAEERLLLGRAY